MHKKKSNIYIEHSYSPSHNSSFVDVKKENNLNDDKKIKNRDKTIEIKVGVMPVTSLDD